MMSDVLRIVVIVQLFKLHTAQENKLGSTRCYKMTDAQGAGVAPAVQKFGKIFLE